jgi:hypothetical protein
MPEYRRRPVSAAAYFFAVNLLDRDLYPLNVEARRFLPGSKISSRAQAVMP